MRVVGVRSEEEIAAQLEARYAELEAEAKSRHRQFPCATCRFSSGSGTLTRCRNPLIVGFQEKWVYAWDCMDGTHLKARLCGPEKALWRQRLSLWQRVLEWLSR